LSGDSESLSFSSIELKEILEQQENSVLFQHVGLIDDEKTTDLMSYLANNWNQIQKQHKELPGEFRESKLAKMVIKKQATTLLSRAVKEGNISLMKRIAGKSVKTRDVSGIKTLKRIESKLGQPAYVCYIFGHMGNGKTDYALLLAELWKSLGNTKNRLLGSNIRSWKQKDQLIEEYNDLEEWIKGEGKKLFVFDEASSHASGYSGDANKTRNNLGKLLKKFRKYNSSLIIIGHTGKDVHPDIRRVANDKIEKTSKKEAIYWKDIKDGEGQKKEFKIKNIPPTNYSYDTQEVTEWSWSQEKESDFEEKKTRQDQAQEIVREIKQRGIQDYLEPYKNKDACKLKIYKITKDFDIGKSRAYEVKEELKEDKEIKQKIK